MTPRRFLPSISSLLALEAVDRLGSATAAAKELSLTHSAVSRQLKVLEGQLGVQLISRDGIRLRPTPAAREYCQSVRSCLQDLSRSSLKLKANPAGGSLNLAILPTFGMHWLAPRLRDFTERCPDITVNLSTRLAPFDFAQESFDAALHFGDRDWQGVTYLPVSREHVVPVCAPSLIDSPPTAPGELLQLPLLHLESRPRAWEDWFESYDHVAEGLHGMLFDQYSTMAQAAVHEMGVALLPSYLAQEEIEKGRLVKAFGEPVPAKGKYYLVWPTARPKRPSFEKFSSWIETVLELSD
ncbi:LysR family transcriptional regulator [Parasphingopyxis algicola]|uniref:LysR family transcriptional regulator n=1 Tax=Parasphingopyxis algicola TaxID=2026624 RepID=UPI001C409CAF|nr:LysR family transcriptional regulator [Parasphingopyxis algicola]